ncbi:alpha-L-fucosidase [Dyella caseinilytica]|uniref:alpha-L-fucosidase n=1 Tax=Dyella caseinilytica TaxID=1849581 RepID=A0ABX7H2D8_9GAMM|nr:alpha-L-fucosidase [Dyella caseinilytica]
MPLSRRSFLSGMALGLSSSSWLPRMGRATSTLRASFQPTWDSLQGYVAPSWFRDAKFGIWAHWTAQCVPEQGDWYARRMYMQGSPQYDYHCRTYGHPSKFGFMEIDNLWKAEHWDPDALMRLYKAAGAKYFVALANHHDNFDNRHPIHHQGRHALRHRIGAPYCIASDAEVACVERDRQRRPRGSDRLVGTTAVQA